MMMMIMIIYIITKKMEVKRLLEAALKSEL
jgi:hypothetical protein